jgi:hypothetical protein
VRERWPRDLHHDRPYPAECRDAVDRRRHADDRPGDPDRAGAGFLGFGIVAPTPSWGNAQELVTTAPALAIYPGLLIFIAVNFLGDGLQHAFDPRSEQ